VLGFAAVNVVAIVIAVLAGLGLSALFGGGSSTFAVLVAVAVFAILMSGKQRRRQLRRRERAFDRAAETARPVAAKRVTPLPSAETPLDLAWAAVAENADWARSRLAVAQESCRLFLGVADRLPMDVEAGGLAVRIRKRIPEHVAECLDRCELSTASERRALLDELVFTLEKVGANADRERTRLLGPVTDELSVQRRHLTREPDQGPITLD
jgi:hypothetical protein